jgi:hypothetical protein
VSKRAAAILVLIFLTAPCIMMARPVSGIPPAENSWVTKEPMHIARGGLGVAVVNAKIYAIGGSTVQDIVGTNEEYDPTIDDWASRTPMPTPRAFFAIAVYQSKIYCIGGATRNGGTTGVNEVYDPATDIWENKAPIPTARYELQANLVNGKIYIIGGTTSDGCSTGISEVYDPSTDTWSTESSMPNAATIYASAVFNNKIYIIGGVSPTNRLNQIYNPETDKWTIGAPPPDGGIGAAVATVGIMAPQRIYVFNNNGANQIYDPEKDTWKLGAGIPTKDWVKFGVAAVNDMIYVMGGTIWTYPIPSSDFVNETPSAVNEQYTPVGYGIPDAAYLLETTQPKISVLSPLNETCMNSSVSLRFTVNKAIDWAGYSVDGKDNVTLTGNATLSGLSNGVHNVTVYAKDAFGNTGASETVTFTVAEPEPFPLVLVIAASVSIATISIGLLVYFKKRKH